jgi:hypothetical protein
MVPSGAILKRLSRSSSFLSFGAPAGGGTASPSRPSMPRGSWLPPLCASCCCACTQASAAAYQLSCGPATGPAVGAAARSGATAAIDGSGFDSTAAGSRAAAVLCAGGGSGTGAGAGAGGGGGCAASNCSASANIVVSSGLRASLRCSSIVRRPSELKAAFVSTDRSAAVARSSSAATWHAQRSTRRCAGGTEMMGGGGGGGPTLPVSAASAGA